MVHGELVPPREVRVLSGDAELLDRLTALAGRGTVHSVFTRVVNVLTPRGELIALTSRDAADAPRALVVDVANWAGQGLVPGHGVTFTDQCLELDIPRHPLRLTPAGARAWRPVAPSLAHLSPGGFAAAAARLDDLNRMHGPRGGMLGPVPGAGPMEAAVAAALDEGRTALVAALRDRNDAAIRRGILALLGLGPGLTPAGDDFLTGLALLAALPGSGLAPLLPALRDTLDEHPGRTTDLSLATLAEAASGRVRSELIDVLRQLADESRSPRALHVPVHAVLAIGHTSGSDTLSGLAAGLHLEEELRGSL
ncbi:oxamate carbamoyltransferase subunit AllH family protein [Streptomyces sp. YJ-C3]